MFLKNRQRKVFLALGVTDMRKTINTLSLLVEQNFGANVLSGDIYVFCNRGRNILKALYWDQNGFAMWMKRVETEKFKWPQNEAELLEIKLKEFGWLLDGLDLSQAFKRLSYERVS